MMKILVSENESRGVRVNRISIAIEFAIAGPACTAKSSKSPMLPKLGFVRS